METHETLRAYQPQPQRQIMEELQIAWAPSLGFASKCSQIRSARPEAVLSLQWLNRHRIVVPSAHLAQAPETPGGMHIWACIHTYIYIYMHLRTYIYTSYIYIYICVYHVSRLRKWRVEWAGRLIQCAVSEAPAGVEAYTPSLGP